MEQSSELAGWRKSSLSGEESCVEVRYVHGLVEVRNSREPTGPTLTFTLREWQCFTAGVALLEFDFSSG